MYATTLVILAMLLEADGWHKTEVIATVVGVVGAWVLLAFTFVQARIARQNTQAIINSERAWIMVEIDWAHGNSRKMLMHGYRGETQVSSTAVSVRLIYTNQGKTIAWVDEKRACFQIVKELPREPDHAALQLLDKLPEWVAPTAVGYIDYGFDVDRQEDMGDISVIWGVINYRDAFAGAHTTVFGFRITQDNRFERIAGLPEYNKNT